MNLPSLDDFLRYEDQWKVYVHPSDRHLFVAGPPGSGKTSLAVERARKLVNEGQTVCLITKGRLLVAFAGHLGDERVTNTTMHKLVSRDYFTRFGAYAPQSVKYVFDWGQIIREYAGREVAPALDHLVIDEAQNLPPQFFSWARRFGARVLDIYADEEQATSDERSTLREIRDMAALPEPFRLTRNHRNTPEIADVAEHFHASAVRLAPGMVVRPSSGEIPALVKIASYEDLIQRALTRLRNRKESIGVIVRYQKEVDEVLDLVRSRLRPGERADGYTSETASGTEADIRLLEPGITVLTGESAFGLEFDSVFLVDLARSLPCKDPADKRRMYMLCARARDSLVLVNGPEQLSSAALAALPPPPTLKR